MNFKEMLDITSRGATILLVIFLIVFGVSFFFYDKYKDFKLKCNAAGGVSVEHTCFKKDATIEIYE